MKSLHRAGIYEKYVKRLLDLVGSAVFLLLFGWLYAVVAVLVRIKLGKPVLFRQPRPGKDEKIFDLYKFRTMTDARDACGNYLPDEKRLTPFGNRLRTLSIDELPEIWLIFLGKMSFVGPRPLLPRYLDRYNDHQHRRHEVKPGLTGYAQVHGRNALSWEEKFDMDVWYVDHLSFWVDMKILVDTVRVVAKREGISSDTSVTMEEFMGTSPEEHVNG